MSASLELDRLSYRYDDKGWAVSELSLSIEPGELVALLGPSGCGKTTTLKLICGLLNPTCGDVRIDGRSVVELAPEQRNIAMVFQKGLLFEHMSVAANVGFGLRMRSAGKVDITRRVSEALKQVHMIDFGPRYPRELSGGEQQRIALARALVTRPSVMLLDEPLSSLDATLRDDMRELIRRLQRAGDHTTLLVTHDQQEAIRLADRVALMLEGRLQMFDQPAAFYERPATRRIAEFFGAANFLEGIVNDGRLHNGLGILNLAGRVQPGACTVTIRPEYVRLGDGDNACRARVAEVNYQGTHMRYTFHTDSQSIVAHLPPHVRLSVGEETTVRLPADALWVLQRQNGG